MTGLTRRGARYAIRRVIPVDLQEHFGRREIVKSLGTSDLKEAKRLAAVAWVEMDKLFEQTRDELAGRAIPEPMPRIGPATISDDEFNWQMEQQEFQRQEAEEDAEAEERVAQLERRLSDPKADLGENELAMRDILNDGRFWKKVADERQTYAKVAPLPEKKPKKGHSLGEVVKAWAADRKPKARSLRRVEQIVVEFEGVHGKVAVEDVTRQQVLAFKDKLVAEGRTPPNINVMLAFFGTVFNYAIKGMHLIDVNPAAGVRVADKRRAKDKRREFTPEALKAIFGSPIYSVGDRPKAAGGEAAYWLPLLALYTGARLNELGQLWTDDVLEESYTDANGKDLKACVIRFVENAERGQEVKNEGSERRVPVHADLIKLGFLEYVRAANAAGLARLFPDLRPAADGVLTGNWSKWFGRYRRKEMGLTGKDTPFHSFRHTFKHYARLSDIAPDVHNEFTGHETGDVADSYGGLSYPLAPLVAGMKRYRIPGLILPDKPARLRP